MSQHLVSAIELLGLVIGLLGFFYLSLAGNLFGKRGARWILPLLTATAFAILSLLSAATQTWHTYRTAPPFLDLPTSNSPRSDLLLALVYSAVGYFTGYNVGRVGEMDTKMTGDFRRAVIRMTIVIVTMSSGLLLVLLLVVHESVDDLLWTAGSSVIILVVLLPAVFLPGMLRNHSQIVKNIGMVATMLAILAQFLPPVLDLLSIPITTP